MNSLKQIGHSLLFLAGLSLMTLSLPVGMIGTAAAMCALPASTGFLVFMGTLLGGGLCTVGGLVLGCALKENHKGAGFFAFKSNKIERALKSEFPNWAIKVLDEGKTVHATKYRKGHYFRIIADTVTGNFTGQLGRIVNESKSEYPLQVFPMAGSTILLPSLFGSSSSLDKEVPGKSIPMSRLLAPHRELAKKIVTRATQLVA